jgi:hypothetical protein
MSRRVVYTAITDQHAALGPRPEIPNTDFICYSDAAIDRDDWQIRPIEAPLDLSPRLRAKYHKLFPPKGYAWNVWIDGAYVLRMGATSFVDDLIAKSPTGFGLHRHHQRDCIFDEAEHAVQLQKCLPAVPTILRQMIDYARRGHPPHWGLWGGGLLCRDNSDRVARIMDVWWQEIQQGSWRDQLSLPVALRELNERPDDWPWPLFSNPHIDRWEWNALV